MSYLKIASACALTLMFASTGANALQKTKTKSNNTNERSAPEGVVLQDSAVGANSCFVGAGSWTWAVSSINSMAGGAGSGAAAASYARAAQAQADLGGVCDGVQSAIDRIDADGAKLAAMDAAIEAQDEAEIQRLLIESGLDPQLTTGAQFHAINTKGTGASNHRGMSGSSESAADDQAQHEMESVGSDKAETAPNRVGIHVTVARVGAHMSFAVSRSYRNKTGHFTLNR
jgi:hypothetical protein